MTADANDVLRLEKITFAYEPREDRLLARVLAADGSRSALWVTQRLALRLVEALARHLDQAAAGDDARHQPQLQSFRHQAALLNSQPGTPVDAIDPAGASLLDTIDVRLSRDQVELQLHLPVRPAVLGLSNDHVRQLLQILLDLFRRAEWPVDAWPAWMRGDAATGSGIAPHSLPSLH